MANSKWVEELKRNINAYVKSGGENTEALTETINRIDMLLRLAFYETDDTYLHEEIGKELNGTS